MFVSMEKKRKMKILLVKGYLFELMLPYSNEYNKLETSALLDLILEIV